MPQQVSSIVSDLWRKTLAQFYSNELTHGGNEGAPTISWPAYFKIGEGGWQLLAGVKLPLDPATALVISGGTDITAGIAPFIAPDDYKFQKALTNADLFYTSPSRVEIYCNILAGEANDDGHGNPPEFFELGVFDTQNRLLVYSTFPIEVKTNSRILQHVIYVDF